MEEKKEKKVASWENRWVPHLCPVCGKFEFPIYGSDDMCDVCKWVDDWYQLENPDDQCGCNPFSLNEARYAYKVCGKAYSEDIDWTEYDANKEKELV